MRSIWSGVISFGLVNIPIKLYPAVESDRIHLNYLRRDDLCPISYKKVCRETGEEVPSSAIVKGYQYQKGDYVVLNEEDFKKADPGKTYTIAVDQFVDEAEVDLRYPEKPYYLEPDKKGSQQVYALLREALKKAKKIGIGTFVLKDRQHLFALKPDGNVILLIMLRFHHQIRDPSKLDLPAKTSIPKNQMDLAMELIEKFVGPFDPKKYHDTYFEKLRQIIEQKKEGKVPAVKEKPAPAAPGRDILQKLKESLSMAEH